MENGATIILESSWALNSLDVDKQNNSLRNKSGSGYEGRLRINKADLGKLVVIKPDLSTGGVDFFEGKAVGAGEVEARSWIDSILNDTEPVVLPEQAFAVTQILEAIYNSAKTGKQIDF